MVGIAGIVSRHIVGAGVGLVGYSRAVAVRRVAQRGALVLRPPAPVTVPEPLTWALPV